MVPWRTAKSLIRIGRAASSVFSAGSTGSFSSFSLAPQLLDVQAAVAIADHVHVQILDLQALHLEHPPAQRAGFHLDLETPEAKQVLVLGVESRGEIERECSMVKGECQRLVGCPLQHPA